MSRIVPGYGQEMRKASVRRCRRLESLFRWLGVRLWFWAKMLCA